MFAAAPPAYVVALLVQVLWIPLRFLEIAGLGPLAYHDRDVNTALNLVASTLLVAASWELVRRGRGRVRAAMAVTLVLNVASFGMQCFAVFAMFRRESSYETLVVLSWLWPICAVLSILAIAIAAGRRMLGPAIAVVVLSLAIYQVPPASRAIGGLVFWLFLVFFPLRNFLLVRVLGGIAKQCYEPVRDHLRASRGFTWLAWLFALRAVLAVAIIAIGTSTTIVQIWLVGIQVALSTVFAYVLWRIAQVQLPQLPRYTLFFAAASVLISVFILAQQLAMIFAFDMANWYEPGTDVETSWWQLLPATLAIACLVVTLGRYAKHAPAIKSSVVLGSSAFTASVCWGLISRDATPTWVSVAIGSIAMIPAFRATAKALAGDPVQTTADVFG